MDKALCYVISWIYRVEEEKGRRKRPPRVDQMWADTAEEAEKIKAEFLAAHPQGRIHVAVGFRPKRCSVMVLDATLTRGASTGGGDLRAGSAD